MMLSRRKLFVAGAVSAASLTLRTVRPSATHAQPAPGDLLYESNWWLGWDGWGAPPSWKEAAGNFVSDGHNLPGGSEAEAPYSPAWDGIDNCAVEAEIRLDATQGVRFGLFSRGKYLGWFGNGRSEIGLLGGGRISEARGYDFRPDADGSWHTYRFEANGNTLTLLKDGGVIRRATDNRFLGGGSVGLYSLGVQLTVRKFRVLAL